MKTVARIITESLVESGDIDWCEEDRIARRIAAIIKRESERRAREDWAYPEPEPEIRKFYHE
jgi:hypothetical protein